MSESGSAGVKGQTQITEPARWERAVARRSAESRATIPELMIELEATVDSALDVARRAGCPLGVLVAYACARVLREHSRVNGGYRDGRFERYERINLGWIVAAPDGYTIPTLFDADRLSLAELAGEIRRLSERAGRSELAAPELGGATFTMWDAGSLGLSRAAVPVVPPQAGALCMGAPRVLVGERNGDMVPTQAVTLSLTCDHRILYGARAAEFLTAIKTQLEEEDQ